jgi:hypothetical protein
VTLRRWFAAGLALVADVVGEDRPDLQAIQTVRAGIASLSP